MMSMKIRTKAHLLWFMLAILCACVAGLLLGARLTCFATDESLIPIVVTRGSVKVTGTGSPRIIDRSGDVRPGEWVEPSQGSVAYLIRDSGTLPRDSWGRRRDPSRLRERFPTRRREAPQGIPGRSRLRCSRQGRRQGGRPISPGGRDERDRDADRVHTLVP